MIHSQTQQRQQRHQRPEPLHTVLQTLTGSVICWQARRFLTVCAPPLTACRCPATAPHCAQPSSLDHIVPCPSLRVPPPHPVRPAPHCVSPPPTPPPPRVPCPSLRVPPPPLLTLCWAHLSSHDHAWVVTPWPPWHQVHGATRHCTRGKHHACRPQHSTARHSDVNTSATWQGHNKHAQQQQGMPLC
jgi:hypothetical protein